MPVIPFFLGGGLRYNDGAITLGEQTERQGDAGPVRVCLAADTHRPLYVWLDASNLRGRTVLNDWLSQ